MSACKYEVGNKKYSKGELIKEIDANPRILRDVTPRELSIAPNSKPDGKLSIDTLRDVTEQLSKLYGIEVVYENNPNADYAGEYHKGKITINEAYLAQYPDAPWHEFAHPIVDTIETSNPRLFDALTEEVLSSHKDVVSELLHNPDYTDDGKTLNQFGTKEAITKVIGVLAMNSFKDKLSEPQKSLLRRVLAWLGNFLSRMGGRAIDISKANPQMSLRDIANILGTTTKSVRLDIQDGPAQYRRLDNFDASSFKAMGYSDTQVKILENIRKGMATVGDPIEVNLKDAPKDIQRMYGKEGMILRTEKVGGGVFWRRPSDANKKVANMSVEDMLIQENDPKSITARETGTEAHYFNELILEEIEKQYGMEMVKNWTNKQAFAMSMLKEFRKNPVYSNILAKIQSGKTRIKHEYTKKAIEENQDVEFYNDDPEFSAYDDLDIEDVDLSGYVGSDDIDMSDPYGDEASIQESEETDDLAKSIGGTNEQTKYDGANVLDRLVLSMFELYYDVAKQQMKIDPKGKAIIMLEQTLVDKANDMVGSPDIAVIYSDGKAAVYDNKFIEFQFTKFEVKNPTPLQKADIIRRRRLQGLAPEYSSTFKEKNPDADDNWYYVIEDSDNNQRKLSLKMQSFENQIQSYSNMLISAGVTSIVAARVIPFAVKYDAVWDPKLKQHVFKPDTQVRFVMTNVDEPKMLKAIPISREMTGNEELDRFIQKLADRSEELSKEISRKKQWDNREMTVKYKNLKDLIMLIQTGTNWESMVDSVIAIQEKVELGLSTIDESDPNYLRIQDIHKILEEVDMYHDLSHTLIPIAKAAAAKSTSANQRMMNAFAIQLSSVSAKLAHNKHSLKTLMTDRLRTYLEKEKLMKKDLFDTYKRQEDLSTAANWFQHLHSINHPLVHVIAKVMDQIDYKKVKERNRLKDRLRDVQANLMDWGERKGIKGVSIYDMIIKETKAGDIELIGMYKSSLYQDAAKARKEKNDSVREWFKNNWHRSTMKDSTGLSQEDRFQIRKQEELDALKSMYKDDKETIDKKMEMWLNLNDITYNEGMNDAWFNNYIRGEYEPKGQDAYSDEYKELLKPENKPMLDFYHLYLDEMNKIDRTSGVRVGKFFIPSIYKDFTETVSQQGILGMMSRSGVYQVYKSMQNAFNSETNTGRMKVKKDKYEKNVPFLFTEQMDGDRKSRDLASSLLLISEAAEEYRNLKEAEGIFKTVRMLANTTPFIKKTADGIVREDNSSRYREFSPENSKLVKTIDTFTNYYLYKETLQADAITDTIGEKGVKLITNMLKLTSRSAMAFHGLSAAGEAINSTTQILAQSYKYLGDKATVAKAMKITAGKDDKSKALAYFFDQYHIASEGLSQADAASVSVSKMRQRMKHDWAYLFQRMVDNAAESTIFASMMLTYAIDPDTGRIARIKKLKSKYPDREFKSIYDSIEETGEGENKTFTIINEHTGQPIEDHTIIDMRTKVTEIGGRIKGQMSDRDIAGFKTVLAGRLLMQFRSWMTATAQDRFRGEGYSQTMEEYEIGKWRAAFRFARAEGLKAGYKFLALMTPLLGSRMDLNLKDNPKMMELYENYVKQNPGSDDPNSSFFVSFDEYVNEYERNIRAVVTELKIFYGLLLALMAAMFYLPEETKDNPFVAAGIAVLNRSMLELGFYLPFEPTTHGFQEGMQLFTKGPFPVINSVQKVLKFMGNTVTESVDLIAGADWDKTRALEIDKQKGGFKTMDRKDDTPIGYYTSDLIGLKHIARMMGIFDTTDKNDTLLEYISAKR